MKKLVRKIVLFFHGLFWGMKSADITISSQVNGEDEEINHKLEVGGTVYDDMLQEKETQRVQETRDATYRVFREADKYDVKLSGMSMDGTNFDDEESTLSAVATKKVKGEPLRIPALTTNGYKILLVQNAKEYENDIITKEKEALTGEAIDTLGTLIFNIKYKDGVIPRFHVERYIQRLIIKANNNNEHIVDLYFSQYARQFVKRDSLFIAELTKIFDGKCKPDIFEDIDVIDFITDKAFGSENLHKKCITNLQYIGINIFDGNFVLEFKCDVSDEDIVAKYKTKELDEKYKHKAAKHESVDLMALARKTQKEEEENNYNPTIIKLQ